MEKGADRPAPHKVAADLGFVEMRRLQSTVTCDVPVLVGRLSVCPCVCVCELWLIYTAAQPCGSLVLLLKLGYQRL